MYMHFLKDSLPAKEEGGGRAAGQKVRNVDELQRTHTTENCVNKVQLLKSKETEQQRRIEIVLQYEYLLTDRMQEMESYESWSQPSSTHQQEPSWNLPENTGRRSSDSRTSDEKQPSRKREAERVQKDLGMKKNEVTEEEGESWPEEIHRQFVSALYDIGLTQASPSVIMEMMSKRHAALTSERIKSHLQKYRNNKDKSKEEFWSQYESWLQKALTVGAAGQDSSLSSPAAIVEMMGSQELLGGDVAAFLTYASLAEDYADSGVSAAEDSPSNRMSQIFPEAGFRALAKYSYDAGAKVPYPLLTEEERKSHLGVSISHVLSMFYSMTNFIMKRREILVSQEERQAALGGSPQQVDSQWRASSTESMKSDKPQGPDQPPKPMRSTHPRPPRHGRREQQATSTPHELPPPWDRANTYRNNGNESFSQKPHNFHLNDDMYRAGNPYKRQKRANDHYY